MYRLFNYSIILYTYSLSRRLRNSVRNIDVVFDGQLTFKDHIAKTARSCRFALHNIRKISSFHTQHTAQLLVQALVISRLRCSSSWTSIKHNQTFTDDSECSGTTGLQRTQKSPCYTSLCVPALAPGCSSHPVQDTDACIQNNHRLSTLLLPLTDDNLHPLQKPLLLPLTITNLHPLQKPLLLPLTITNLHPLQKPEICE